MEVARVSIRDDDAGGGAAIGTADHLTMVDQITLILAGREAEHVFDSPTSEEANFDDLKRLIDLLRGVTET